MSHYVYEDEPKGCGYIATEDVVVEVILNVFVFGGWLAFLVFDPFGWIFEHELGVLWGMLSLLGFAVMGFIFYVIYRKS